MTALRGFHHVLVLTTDLHRLLDFYRTVFDAPAVLEGTNNGRRHAMIDVGGGGLLHAFLVPDGEIPLADSPRYQRGRLDHLALNAPTREAFHELRRRAIGAGATDGHVRDSGALCSFTFCDPDGMEGEVIWANPEVPLSSTPLHGNRHAVNTSH
jgi:catechol 2,3-dioxygenase-like lactoylglutathione lyase family enzyme